MKVLMETLEGSNKSLPNVISLLHSNPFCKDLFEESVVAKLNEQAHQQNCTEYTLVGKGGFSETSLYATQKGSL